MTDFEIKRANAHLEQLIVIIPFRQDLILASCVLLVSIAVVRPHFLKSKTEKD